MATTMKPDLALPNPKRPELIGNDTNANRSMVKPSDKDDKIWGSILCRVSVRLVAICEERICGPPTSLKLGAQIPIATPEKKRQHWKSAAFRQI